MMQKRKSVLKRSIALLLMLATLLSIFPVSVFATQTANLETNENVADIMILHKDAEISSLTLAEDGKETLTAHVTIGEYDSRAWQIRIPDTEEWVSISGRSGETLDVTYALIGSMLNESGRAYLRHVMKSGETLYESKPVEVILSYTTPEGAEITDASGMTLSTYSVRSLSVAAQTDATDESGENGTSGEASDELISIVINYLFDNGGLAFEPYGATIAKGSDFSTKITSPDVTGYDPFRRVGADYIDASTVEFDLKNVQENVTVNVIYEPAMVEFQIHHHLQNINDDEYSLHPDYITKGHGLTGSKIPDALTMDIPGFKPLAYEKEITIAADGSTVVEIRYDRNYYLLSFEMAGGYGTDPVYARYGTTVGANPPTRHGYIFSGWELISYSDAVPSDAQKSTYDINGEGKTIALPAANLKYLAKWVTQLTTYTMVFWKENINDNGFTYWGYLDGLTAMSGSLVSGADRVSEADGITEDDYFTYNDALTDKDVIVEGDGSTIVNVYYTRNRYSITFKAPGKCVIEENHTHTKEQCYVTLCGAHHIHTESCSPTLRCTTPEHTTHTDGCLQCDVIEHVHSQSCYCDKAEHTHTTSCWNNASSTASQPSGAPSNPADGQIYYRRIFLTGYYYIYIKGEWYRYNGTASSGNIVDPDCDYISEHTHTTACITCGFDTEHAHTDTCYSDVLHTHGTNCYTYACGDKEHVHTDTCYLLNCGIPTGHTHSGNCNSASRTNTVKIIYAKYQANLETFWPITDDNGVTYDSGERWSPSDSSYYSAVLVFIANMPADDFTLTLDTSSYTPYTMNYYLEVLPGESYTHTYDGRNYMLYTSIKASYNYITKAEDFFDIHGYTQLTSDPVFSSNNQISLSGNDKTVDFYYAKMTDHALEFSSNGSIIAEKTQTGIMYGAPIEQYNFTPDYPSNLEQGAFLFGGWYTSPGCYDGTEVDWSTATMEAGGMLLYAKWEPIVHTLEIYTKYENGEYLGKIGDTQLVSHNHFASSPATNPKNGNYIFQGWFYIDKADNKEKAFVFTGIPVDQDMKIFAKWSSDISVNYKIYYELEKDGTPIADPTEGVGIAGHNKTFLAKVDTALYAGYQSGYYPLTSSHTVTMSAEVEEHVFTFKYVYVESVPYEVRYVDKNGTTVFATKEVKENNLSVVTETFVKVDKMMPDAYQKRLVLSAEGNDADNNGILDNNVITFVYEKDTEHAYYKVVHYIQHIADDGYREYRSEETKGVIGKTYSITPITLAGFSFNAEKALLNGQKATVTNGTITATLGGADGMLIELYYDRVNVTYTVNYLEKDTDKVLYTAKTGTGLYGAQVVEQAIGLTHLGYTLEGVAIKQLHLSFDNDHNVISFYYKESTYALKYEIVGSTEGGTLTQTSENVSAITGEANGSAPIIQKGYKFIGWFLDEACSAPVPADWVDAENKLMPGKDNGGDIWLSNRTFYAKVEPNVTSMTISTHGASTADAGQVFIYRVTGISDGVKHIDFTVTVTGNDTVTVSDLAVGDYRVTELTDWSYRYSVASADKDISLSVDPAKNTVTFSHVRSFTQWLDGNHSITNIFSSN